ncbi:DUF4352 domain-containing protein [Listeria valentina]|uniref:DUF4352 domain-containing protein n=1 Tax=Listeria valentina TaxID=2705293 RepID=UPI0014307696|nr:DUF4352 domain-containing protein [Listeria valentina]
MKKRTDGILLSLLLLAVLSVLAACSNDSNAKDKEEKKSSTKTEFVSKTVNNMNIKINSISTTDSAKGNKNMVEIKMLIKNKDSGEVSIGAGDFKIKADKKTYDVYPQGNNFGDVIKEGKELTGSAFFELPKSVKKGQLVYEVNQKEAASWDVTVPEAE